jgi:uncharacterized repeat protein (TIGR01451 family)
MGVRIKSTAIALAVAMVGALLALPAAVFTAAPASAATIASSGPLTNVTTTPDLNCAVNHAGDSAGEFYGDTACGTLAVVGGTLYSPANIPAGQPGVPWTPVSQVGPTGAGTAGDPYRVVTVVAAGATGVRLTQTDTYVVGQESFRTDVAVANTGGASATVRLYRAGDCFLQDSDTGYGVVDASSGAVACKSPSSERIEQFLPITPGSSYYEAYFGDVWSRITAQLPFPNTCACESLVDNGAGLSWDATLAAGASTTISSILTFSPLGVVPLTVTKSADAPSTAAGGTNGYTITIDNPNVIPATLSSITDTLPTGFSYIAGSTTGATTANPTVGSSLVWSGPIGVPAEGSVSLHFGVNVSTTAGIYNNNATAAATGFTVAPTGDTAPITVTSAVVLGVTSTGQPANVTAGANAQRLVTVTNSGAAPATGVSLALSVPAGVTLVSRTPSQGSCGTVVSGVVTCTLGTIGGGGSANVQYVLRMPAAVPPGGTVSTSATATATGGATAGPAASVTTVTPVTPGQATGYVPPGGTITTGADATAGDNTVSSLTLPNTGPGAVVTLTAVPCASGVCNGKTVTFNSFPGYDDPAHPFKLTQTWDKTVAGNGYLSQLYVQKEGQTTFSVVAPCQPAPQLEKVWNGKKWIWRIKRFIVTLASWLVGGHTGYANPSPCVDAKTVLSNGDVRFETLFLSGDPSVRRR